VAARCLAVVLLAGAVLAGCGGASSRYDPLVALHLGHSTGPLPGNASIYAPGIQGAEWSECSDLWGFLRVHPHAEVPGISASKVNVFRTAGERVAAAGDSARIWVLDGYVNACTSLFRR
jgi:hypothetical protein